MMWKIDRGTCNTCGACVGVCPVNALTLEKNGVVIDRDKCTECGACQKICPVAAIEIVDGKETEAGDRGE